MAAKSLFNFQFWACDPGITTCSVSKLVNCVVTPDGSDTGLRPLAEAPQGRLAASQEANLTAGSRPKRSLALHGIYVRYGLLTGRPQISNAECPLQTSSNAYSRPVSDTLTDRATCRVVGSSSHSQFKTATPRLKIRSGALSGPTSLVFRRDCGFQRFSVFQTKNYPASNSKKRFCSSSNGIFSASLSAAGSS